MGKRREGLARARKAVGLTQEELAAEIGASEKSVRDWEAGRSEPQPFRRPVYAEQLHLTLTELEHLLREGIAWAGSRPAASVNAQPELNPAAKPLPENEYSPSLELTIRTLSTITDDLGSIAGTPSTKSSYLRLPSSAVISWLFNDAKNDVAARGAPIKVVDVDEIVATTKALDRLDRQFGGDYSRDLAAKYLQDRVLPQLRRPASESLRRELFQAAAVLCEVIGYMAYDGQHHALATRYFVQSLRLAKEAGSTVYGSFVLSTMSHQALYCRQIDQALTLARAAQQTAPPAVAPTVAAEAAMLEASALAAAGDSSTSLRALDRAEAAFNRRTPETDTPYWMAHWDSNVFAGFASDVWLDLGNANAAAPYLEILWNRGEQQVRRKVFAAGQAARAAFLERDVERSVHYGTITIDAAAAAKSKRSHRIARDLVRQLTRFKQLPPVRELTDRAIALLPSEGP